MADTNTESLAILAKAADGFVRSERRGRWFTNLLKLSVAIYLLGSLVLLSQSTNLNNLQESEPHVAVVSLSGAIMPETPTSADAIAPLLKEAFENKQSQAVILKMNSPGGSAVQSGLIYDEIIRLKKAYPNKPIYSVSEDLCASGCYYIASATDKIFADKASIIGSIGVRFDSFGVTSLMEKLGVENRSLSAGEHKRLLDPFSPADVEAQQHLQSHVLARTHEQFKQAVRSGRGDRLKETPELFTGLVWIGDEAVSMGLIDGLGDIRRVARDELKQENLVDYATEEAWIDRLSKGIGSQLSAQLTQRMGLNF